MAFVTSIKLEETQSESESNETDDVKLSASELLKKRLLIERFHSAAEMNKAGIEERDKYNNGEALRLFRKAIVLYPNDLTYYNNAASMLFERQLYNKAINISLRGIKATQHRRLGQLMRKLTSRAFWRIAKSFFLLHKFYHAVIFMGLAMERQLTVRFIWMMEIITEEAKMITNNANLPKSQEKFEKANEFFEKADYYNALRVYTTAIMYNEEDVRSLVKRAICFERISASCLALTDCHLALELDDKCVEAYLCKARVAMNKEKFSKAGKYFQKAISLDAGNVEAYEGYSKCCEALKAEKKTVKITSV